jgi:crossover junction endodeoxyribonuclease RuvC
MMYASIGLDLSLSNTGIAMIASGGKAFCERVSHGGGAKDMTIAQELLRIREMGARVAHKVLGWVAEVDLPPENVLFTFEGPSIGSVNGKPHERAGLWWLVANEIHTYGQIAKASPATNKKYWTGNGAADKKLMLTLAKQRYPELVILDDNVADALSLADMGARHLGIPMMPRPPQVNLGSLMRAEWPTTTEGA